MIIRFTLKTSYYTQIIERFFDDKGPFVLANHNSKAEYEQFMKDVKQLNSGFYGKKDLKPKLEETIKQTFINYINNVTKMSNWKTVRFNTEKLQRCKDDIFKNIDIKLVDLFVDRSKNQEVVFYIDWISNYITM